MRQWILGWFSQSRGRVWHRHDRPKHSEVHLEFDPVVAGGDWLFQVPAFFVRFHLLLLLRLGLWLPKA